jgi:hypothetical protein
MKAKVTIYTQYYENYNVGSDGFGDVPQWKPKGGHEFEIEMDTDTLLYCDDADKIFSKMVSKHNSVAEKFEYKSYKIHFSEPTKLGTEAEFEEIWKSMDNNMPTPTDDIFSMMGLKKVEFPF